MSSFDIDYVAIGKRIYYKRKKLKVSQHVICEKANINDKYLSKIENAKTKASLKVLNNIASALNTSLDYVINGIHDIHADRDVDRIYKKMTQLSEEQLDFIDVVITALIDK